MQKKQKIKAKQTLRRLAGQRFPKRLHFSISNIEVPL
jgi:hypothetical protein